MKTTPLLAENQHAREDAPKRVLIVGAGPTGLTAAAFLAKQNIEFDLIDARAGPVDESRALGVHARTLEFMSMLGLDGEFIAAGHPTRYMTFHRGARKLFKLDFNSIAGQTDYPYMLVLPQSKSERILAGHLTRVGAAPRWQSVLKNFSQDETGVTADIAQADGQLVTRRYSYLIGCDGAGSMVRTRLGIDFEGETYPLRFLLSEVKVGEDAIDRSSSHVFMGSKTTVAVIPQPEGVYRVVGPDFSAGMDSTDASGATNVEFSDFEKFLKDNDLLQHVSLDQPSRLVSYRIHKRVAAQFGKGRVFIAGDAAHIHSPAGGQGMNTGLNDVANLTWKIAAVLDGSADASLLESYETERRPAALSIVTNADAAMMKVVSRKLGPRFFFDYIAPLMTRFYQPSPLLAAMAQISWSYRPHGAASVAGPKEGPAPGSRLANHALRGGGYSNHRLGGKRHVAFISGEGAGAEAYRRLFSSWRSEQQPQLFSFERPLQHNGGKSRFEGIVLSRPDGYIAATYPADALRATEPLHAPYPHVARI
nr:Pentachlorophenol 4-monooxygenase [Paraburkholderia busanensis]